MAAEIPGHGTFSRALVVGAARSGLSAARLLAALGAEVAVADRRAAAELAEEAATLASFGAELLAGGHPPELAERFDLLVVSPGVPLAHPLFARAAELGRPVIGEVELARPFLRALVVGITGTNGKSTTTALVAEIGKAAGLRSEPAGNFGRPLCDFALAGEAGTPPVELLSVELSSFQLEAISKFRADAATVLNVTPDHLDRYAGLAEYAAAKARVFENQDSRDAAVVNADDPTVAEMSTRGRRFEFSRLQEVGAGCFVREGAILWKPYNGPSEFLIAADHLRIPGPHNLENALAAATLARALDLPARAVATALATFPGLPHRCEPVGEISGILFVNDSKGTNVDAALRSYAAFPKNPVFWILGGRDKAGDFAPIAESISAGRNVRAVLTVGEAAPKIGARLQAVTRVVDCASIERAIDVALSEGQPGDVVLLSPACASFDQFRNFEHRGDEFRRWVRERGAVQRPVVPGDPGAEPGGSR